MSARRALLGGAAGVALALAMPPFGASAVGLATFALLALALDGATAREAALAAWCAGFAAFALTGTWFIPVVPRFTGAPAPLGVVAWAASCAWMALAFALGGYLTARTRPALGPALAASLSFWSALRYGPRLFPYPLALPLVDLPALPQSADLVGVEGLGAALLGSSVGALNALRRKEIRAMLLALAAPVALAGYGAARSPSVARDRAALPTLEVALVQPVVGAALRWDDALRPRIHEHLQAVTRLGAEGAGLTVWHEGAFPYELPFAQGVDGARAPEVLPGWGAPLLFGAMARAEDPEDPRRYNAAFVRTPQGALRAPVAKRRLLPFGEYVPLAVFSPALHRAVTEGGGISPGPDPQRIAVGDKVIGVLNCFEDTLPEAGAELAGADLLVNLTNDAWFDGANNDQHVLAARWRAIELRRDLVRASNAGRSAHIDALGAVRSVAPQGVVDVLRARARVGGAAVVAPRVIVWGPRVALAAVVAAWWVARRREQRR